MSLITYSFLSNKSDVFRYLPYGALSEVLPYLGRRASENKTVLGQGGAEQERKRAWELIRARASWGIILPFM